MPILLRRTHACLLAIVLSISAAGCKSKAQRVVDNAIQKHGGSAFKSFELTFGFRDRKYTGQRDGGLFTYIREFKDTTGLIRDVLNNDGFTRYINGAVADIPEERKQAYTRSVNSVIYFALLPFGLNDDAVIKEWIGTREIRGQLYDEVRVSFRKDGGGEDHEDVFLYWFHSERNTMDYFAYTYATDGGGIRFREAINPRQADKLLLQDYINYKPGDETIPLDSIMSLFLAGQLLKLSEIRLENVAVTPFP